MKNLGDRLMLLTLIFFGLLYLFLVFELPRLVEALK